MTCFPLPTKKAGNHIPKYAHHRLALGDHIAHGAGRSDERRGSDSCSRAEALGVNDIITAFRNKLKTCVSIPPPPPAACTAHCPATTARKSERPASKQWSRPFPVWTHCTPPHPKKGCLKLRLFGLFWKRKQPSSGRERERRSAIIRMSIKVCPRTM